MTVHTASQAFFETKYRQENDPWRFTSSSYERGRYQAILHALEPRQYRRAFEPGCSIGVLTEQLASICGRLEAMDISPTAVERARERCQGLTNVSLVTGSLPADLPAGPFDLILFNEIGYYFDELTLRILLSDIVARLEHGAVLLATHWLGSSPDHALSGDHVHETIHRVPELTSVDGERYEHFRLDRWVRL